MKKLLVPLLPVALVFSAIAQTPPNPIMQPATPNQGAPANAGPILTLADAEHRALEHQPRLLAEKLRAQAATRGVTEAKSAYYPQLNGNITAVQSNGDVAVAAGGGRPSLTSPR